MTNCPWTIISSSIIRIIKLNPGNKVHTYILILWWNVIVHLIKVEKLQIQITINMSYYYTDFIISVR